MVVFPVLVVVLNGIFAGLLLSQFAKGKRPQQAAWAAALILGLFAALFYLLFLGSNDETVYFKLYYLSGGLLMAAYLGLGSVYLHVGRRAGDILALLLIAASLLAAGFLFSAPIDMGKLRHAA